MKRIFSNVEDVVPEGSAELVVVHVGLGLALTPAPCHLVGVNQFELALSALPRDPRRVASIGQQFQQELPQLDLTGTAHFRRFLPTSG